MIDIFPETPYTFFIETMTGFCRLEFPKTQYHEPVPGVTLEGHEIAVQEVHEYFRSNNIGMWGYPIESLDFCSPLDIHANLLLNKNLSRSKLIRDFRVIGFIPDELPDDIHPDNHDGIEDDEDGEEGTEVIFEAAAAIRTPITESENIQRGRDAMKRVISQHVNEPKAMYRKELGWIAFYWGKAGGPAPKCKGGDGVAKIIAKRDWEGENIKKFKGQKGRDVALKLVEVIAKGKLGKEYGPGLGTRVNIEYNNYRAILSMYYEKKEKIWLLNGFKNEKNVASDESGGGSDPAGSTLEEPIRTRLTEGAKATSFDNILGPKQTFVKSLLESAAIDREAHKAAASPKNSLPVPTEKQKESGNYKKGHVTIQGLDIAIENPAGSERSGIGAGGKKWVTKMKHHYGYIKETVGKDKDHLDVFLGTDPEKSQNVFIVNQINPETGAFDEHKIMLGFETVEEGKEAYLSNYEKGWKGIGEIVQMSMDDFKDWLKNGDKTKPANNALLESAVGETLDWRESILKATSFDDIEDAFAAAFGPVVIKKFINREISELEKKMQELRSKAAKYFTTGTSGEIRGSKTTAFLNDNSPIELQYAVLEAEKLITSHSDEMSINKEFTQTLQPRDRAREGMKLQVDMMAGKLNPERLGESTSVSTGAPIIGQDMTVESGNGRTIAIRKAYALGTKGQEYKQWIIDNAADFGIPVNAIEEMRRPVLVRIRLTDIDRAEFARKANEDEIAQMAPAELARADAAKLTDDDVALFEPSEDGSIASASNRPFITRFFERMGKNAATGYMTKDGKFTKQLIDRVQAAIFSKAYQDDYLLELMAEEADPRIKNILSAMTIAAGEFSRAKAIDPALMGIDIPRHVIEAAKIIKKAREDGQAVDEALSQTGLFEEIQEDTKAIALFIDKNIRSARRMGNVLKESAKILRRTLIDEKEPKLLDTGEPLPTAAQIVAMAIEKEKEASLFEAIGKYHNDTSWIGVDLDGTLARYDGWIGDDYIGEPIPLMVDFVKHLIETGNRVKIFTARAADPEKIKPVKDWLEKIGIGGLEVTNVKDSGMIKLYDDRAAKVILNTGAIMEKADKFDWKKAIGEAKTFEDLQAVFRQMFPVMSALVGEKQPWQMKKSDFIVDTELSKYPNHERSGPAKHPFKEGDLMIDGYGANPYVYQMQYINPKKVDFGLEGQSRQNVVNMPSTQKYIEWAKEGLEAPPVSVVRNTDSGRLYSTNRRRIVAAQEAGLSKIPAFIEIGRHKDIIRQAISEGKPVSAKVLKDYPDLKTENNQ